MKKTLLILSAIVVLSGCVTRKVAVMPEAENINPVVNITTINNQCEVVSVYTLEDSHPNNVTPTLKNAAYLAGANGYRIIEVTETHRSRPSSVIAEFYRCVENTVKTSQTDKLSVSSQLKLLPGAQSVVPIAFSEVENNSCKILTTQVFKEASSKALEVELANQTYMLGGNRFHITKLLEEQAGEATSVVADIYRCKHRTIDY